MLYDENRFMSVLFGDCVGTIFLYYEMFYEWLFIVSFVVVFFVIVCFNIGSI